VTKQRNVHQIDRNLGDFPKISYGDCQATDRSHYIGDLANGLCPTHYDRTLTPKRTLSPEVLAKRMEKLREKFPRK